jgi:6,7-dimethyl-8-ribityllumazine synthase
MSPKAVEGGLQSGSARIGVIVSRWNELVTRRLLDGALATLARQGVPEDRVEVIWAPGCWEIPLAAQALARTGRVNAAACLGAILKGETPHAEHLAAAVSAGLSRVSLDTGLPIAWGILTCDNLDQALARAGAKMGNKGSEAAMAALEMISLLERISRGDE